MLNFASFLYSLNNDLGFLFVLFCRSLTGGITWNDSEAAFRKSSPSQLLCRVSVSVAILFAFWWWCCSFRFFYGSWLNFCLLCATVSCCAGVWLQTNPQVVIVQVCGYRQTHRWLLFRCLVTD